MSREVRSFASHISPSLCTRLRVLRIPRQSTMNSELANYYDRFTSLTPADKRELEVHTNNAVQIAVDDAMQRKDHDLAIEKRAYREGMVDAFHTSIDNERQESQRREEQSARKLEQKDLEVELQKIAMEIYNKIPNSHHANMYQIFQKPGFREFDDRYKAVGPLILGQISLRHLALGVKHGIYTISILKKEASANNSAEIKKKRESESKEDKQAKLRKALNRAKTTAANAEKALDDTEQFGEDGQSQSPQSQPQSAQGVDETESAF